MSESKRLCPNCGGDIDIRNPTGKCDHLYYPDNVPKKPSGWLVELDEEEVSKVVGEILDENNYGRPPMLTINISKAICQRFGQREIKYPTKDMGCMHTYKDEPSCYECSPRNEVIDEFKKLNPDTKEN